MTICVCDHKRLTHDLCTSCAVHVNCKKRKKFREKEKEGRAPQPLCYSGHIVFCDGHKSVFTNKQLPCTSIRPTCTRPQSPSNRLVECLCSISEVKREGRGKRVATLQSLYTSHRQLSPSLHPTLTCNYSRDVQDLWKRNLGCHNQTDEARVGKLPRNIVACLPAR